MNDTAKVKDAVYYVWAQDTGGRTVPTELFETNAEATEYAADLSAQVQLNRAEVVPISAPSDPHERREFVRKLNKWTSELIDQELR